MSNMTNEGYKMSMAEFRGKALQSLEDIKDDVGELKSGMMYMNTEITTIKVELAKKAGKKDIAAIQKQITGIKIISSTLGAVGGLLTGLGAFFLRK